MCDASKGVDLQFLKKHVRHLDAEGISRIKNLQLVHKSMHLTTDLIILHIFFTRFDMISTENLSFS